MTVFYPTMSNDERRSVLSSDLDGDLRAYLLSRLEEFSSMARVIPSRAAIFTHCCDASGAYR